MHGPSYQDILQHELLEVTKHIVESVAKQSECEGHAVCSSLKYLIQRNMMKDVINLDLHGMGHKPFLSVVDCNDLFPFCVE